MKKGVSIELTKDKLLGEYWALKNNGSKKPFKNPMQAGRTVEIFKTDRVVDIGAYIGEYSMFAARFAKTVVSYEATPETFNILQLNIRDRMTVFNKAVVGTEEKKVLISLSDGVGVTNSILNVGPKSRKVSVPAVKYDRAVKEATVVKIDVEGAEYGYDIIKPNLRAIILEFHPLPDFDWRTKASRIMLDLQKAGFRPTYKIPKFLNGWDTNSAWVRRI